jgi:hypothetical protein
VENNVVTFMLGVIEVGGGLLREETKKSMIFLSTARISHVDDV